MQLRYMALDGLSGHQAGRQLLTRLYEETTGRPMPQILTESRGKPYFAEGDLHFSVSHTKRYAFCVLSERNIGIDAEEIDREINLSLAEKILRLRKKRDLIQPWTSVPRF